jgi:diacylglycerol kinase (ATP)
MTTPAGIFVNEGAANARTARVGRAVDLARRALGADLHVTATRDPAELEAWLRARLAGSGYRTAIIVGGDGSLGVGFNVAAGEPDMALGYIPAGFGNATAHLLRLPRGARALASVLVAGDTRPIDLVEVDGRLALFVGAGWDALVADRYARAGARRLPGWAAAVSRSVPDLWRRHLVAVEADGRTIHEGPMELLVAGTTPFYGRGLRVNPGARPDAGQMTMRVYPGPAPHLALEVIRWATRRHPAVPGLAASSVTLRSLDERAIPLQADGDVLGRRTAWAIAIRPSAVRLIGRWS